jgi:hypothetical protein
MVTTVNRRLNVAALYFRRTPPTFKVPFRDDQLIGNPQQLLTSLPIAHIEVAPVRRHPVPTHTTPRRTSTAEMAFLKEAP